VIDTLERRHAAGPDRDLLRQQLLIAPWCWPRDDDISMPFAIETSGLERPPTLPPGVCLAVTLWNESSVTLWRLEAGPDAPSSDIAFDNTARRSWSDSSLAIPRSVPVLWESIADVTRFEPRAYRIDSWSTIGTAVREHTIEGPSFGLSFSLLLASRLFDIPVPPDTIASAEVTADGEVKQIEGLATKIRGTLALAPRVTRIIVSVDQQAEAEIASGGRLQVIGVRSVAEALRRVFGDALEQALIRFGNSADTRTKIVSCFLRLAVAARNVAIEWDPIARAALLALESWPSLSQVERFSLRFTQAIAERHDRNAGAIPIPPEDWLSAQPIAIRLAIASQLVQQSADTGFPTAEEAEQWVRRYAPVEPSEAYPEQLRLLGAEARLWSVTGKQLDALRRQESVTQACWRAFDASSISYSLSEWFRLAAACEDPLSVERAERLYQEVKAVAGFSEDSESYVQLSRARAALRFNRLDSSETWATLVALRKPRVPRHIYWSSTRSLLRMARNRHDRDVMSTLVSELNASDQHDAHKQRILAAMEDAIENQESADDLLAQLSGVDPGPTTHLLRAARHSNQPAPEFVLRFFPY